MKKNNNIVNFNDDDLNIIKENIHSIYNKILNTRFKQMITRSVYKIITNIILTLGLIAIIIAIATLLLTKVAQTFYLILIIFGTILMLFAILLVAFKQVFLRKIKQEFLSHDINYLKMAVNATFKEVEISNINNEFTIIPQKFLIVGSNINDRVWTEKVIIGNINNKSFNCGTMVEQIVRTYKIGKTTTTTTTYNRYLYFTCLIDVQDVVTTIVPETITSRIMGSNRGDQLESIAFEKLFALDYSDPIKLRKLLVPKVMEQMIDLANNQKPLPRIFVNNNQVTLMFSYMNIGSVASASGNLVNLIAADNEEKILVNVINMLNSTLDIINNCYQWVVSLDLAKELMFK